MQIAAGAQVPGAFQRALQGDAAEHQRVPRQRLAVKHRDGAPRVYAAYFSRHGVAVQLAQLRLAAEGPAQQSQRYAANLDILAAQGEAGYMALYRFPPRAARVVAREPQARCVHAPGARRRRAIAAEIHQAQDIVAVFYARGVHLAHQCKAGGRSPLAAAAHGRPAAAQLRNTEDACHVSHSDPRLILKARVRRVQVVERAVDLHLGCARS